jgi:F-type H+-transporting ATPase subunit epsilon
MSGAVEVHVVTPEREVWTGQAEIVIARGVDGEVGILAGHAPMMVQLAIGPLRIQTEGQAEIAAVIDGGFLHVSSAADRDETSAADRDETSAADRDEMSAADRDEAGAKATRVDVLATGAELAGDIDLEAARARAAELQERLQDHDTHLAEAEIVSLRSELKKALARISLAS